ncbi:hypothetical protein M569_08303, partial [Genlisea aurea]
PQEYSEITAPSPLEYLTPSCALPLLSHTFANTVDSPPTIANYSAPHDCTWSRALLHLSAASNGTQYDRIAAVWLSGVELLRTSTPEPTPDGIFWNVRKDVTRYSALLRRSNLTLAVMLENVVNDVYTGVYRVNLTFLYYDGIRSTGELPFFNLLPPPRDRPSEKEKNPLDLDENPADLIIPISAAGDEGGGFWFRLESQFDAIYQGIRFPSNTYRAVVEIYVSFHGNDEFWYSNPPDSYIETNHLATKRGHGAYREVSVKIDDDVIGTVIPFPVIFTGGINPLFWEPLVSIGAFDLPSYEIDLTPFLGILLDGDEHFIGLSITDAISFWLVDANLHLWLDRTADSVQAGAVRYRHPSSCVTRVSAFEFLDGSFELHSRRDSEFSGWVNSSAGNFTTYVSTRLKFDNTIRFTNNGTDKAVNQNTKLTVKRRLLDSSTGESISDVRIEKKYPIKITTANFPGSADQTYLSTTKLDHSIKDERRDRNSVNRLSNTQKSIGWMFISDHDLLSGGASTVHKYEKKNDFGCYSRHIWAAGGAVKNDTETFYCPTS